MNNVTDRKIKLNKPEKIKKVLNIAKKVLMYTGIVVGAIILLALLYKVLQYLFVGALLFIAWLFPGKWW